MITQRMTSDDWHNSYGDTVLKGPAGTAFVRRLAASVMGRAVQDLAGPADDARTALVFLFGYERDCAGWLGLVDVSVDWMRPRVVRYYETVRDRFPGGDHSAKLRRQAARLALMRIREYVQKGILPPMTSKPPRARDAKPRASRRRKAAVKETA